MPTPSKPWFVRYEFTLPGKEPATFTVELDGKTLANPRPAPEQPAGVDEARVPAVSQLR
ncbi:MAG: hypothetical protein U0228_36630 [Myxococcaceae bacterium]